MPSKLIDVSSGVRFATLAVTLLATFGCAAPSDSGDTAPATTNAARAPSSQADARTVLLFTRTEGFHHDSIPLARNALDAALRIEGFDVVTSDDPAIITTPSLHAFVAVVFVSTSGDVLDESNEHALQAWIEAGGGWVGVHAALDTEYDWPFYGDVVAARFDSHPAIQMATVHVEDAKHQSMAGLPSSWSRTDEWYNTRGNPRHAVHVLATVDESTYADGAMGADHPIVWCHSVGRGQAFVTAMGHTDGSWTDPLFVNHVVGGIVSVTRPDDCRS